MGRQEIGDLKNIIYNMKTALTLAFQRIELMKDLQTDSIHWEMFKRNYLEMEKNQTIDFAYGCTHNVGREDIEIHYNETYTDDKD
jgi:hypothetical protein